MNAHTARHPGLRAIAAAIALTITGGLLALGGAAPASAGTSSNYCIHGNGATLIDVPITLTTTPGYTQDVYVQRYNGSAWVYVTYTSGGRQYYVMQTAYSTTAGWWMTPAGREVNDASFNLTPGSGYYRLVGHLYSSTWSSPWTAIYGYSDNLRGVTSWCQA